MNADQIRKLPVGPVLDLLRAGVYMEIGNFRIHADDHPVQPLVHSQVWDGESWVGQQMYWMANINGVANMLITFANEMEADNDPT